MNQWYKMILGDLKANTTEFLMTRFNEFEKIFLCNEQWLVKAIGKSEYVKLLKCKDIELSDVKELLDKKDIGLISYKDERYPILLKNITKPPMFLYYKGNIDLISEKSIGVVGTRKMTNYGKSATKKITKGLVDSGVTIISGLALGVDAVAHKTALDYSGKTIAVVGSGLDIKYPAQNARLWDEIEREGLILSEYPTGTEPFSWNFPQRNRIIVGLSKGIAVMESYKKGGALLSAGIALEENRDVFAVPGFISYNSFAGCNNLIKNSKAKLINNASDILEDYNWNITKTIQSGNISGAINLNEQEKKILKSLVVEKNLDQLIIDTNILACDILALISEMEIKGIVKSLPGGKYVKADIY